MSRSYRKFPIIKDSHHRDRSPIKPKDFANRAVRRYKEVPIGKSCFFKKIYCSWFISDYRFIGCMNETELKNEYEKGNRRYCNCSTYEEAMWLWKKYYINK